MNKKIIKISKKKCTKRTIIKIEFLTYDKGFKKIANI